MGNRTDWTRRSVLRTVAGAAIGGTLALGETGKAAGQSGESWPQFGYDDANTGHAPGNIGVVADVEEQWAFETIGSVQSSPVVVDDTVYVGSQYTYPLDSDDGTEQWRFQTRAGMESSPAVVDGIVYVGSNDTNVYAITGETPTATSTQTATRSGDRDGRDDSDRTDGSGSSGSSGSGSTSGTATSIAVPDAASIL